MRWEEKRVDMGGGNGEEEPMKETEEEQPDQ